MICVLRKFTVASERSKWVMNNFGVCFDGETLPDKGGVAVPEEGAELYADFLKRLTVLVLSLSIDLL